MKKILLSTMLSILISATAFSGVSVDWVQSGTGTGTWSDVDSLDNVFVTSWDGSIYLKKYDEFGNEQWEVNYSTAIIFNYLYPSRVHVDNDGNAIVVGYRYTSPTEGRNVNAIIVLKYDTDGNLIWEEIIPGTFSFFNNSSYRTNVCSVMDDLNNVYIGTGGNVSGYPTTGFNTIKVNEAGNIVWVSAVNMTGVSYHFVSNIQLKGNKLVLAGHNLYWVANAAVWLLDTSGNSKWYKTQAGIGGQDAVIDGTGKVYLLTSTPGYPSDISLYRYKPNGTLIWNKTFDQGGADLGYRMLLAPDNKLAILAYGTQTGISLYTDWLTMKVSLNGALVWAKRYDTHSGNDEIPNHFAIDSVDGDIFVTGIGGPFPGGPNLGARQFVTVKYTSNGVQKWVYSQDTINEYASGVHISIDSRGNLFVAVDIVSLTYHLLDNSGTAPCSVPTGISVSGITDESAIISWAPVTNAYLYHVQYKTTTSPVWTTISTDQTSANLTGLFTGTTYQYRVEAICNSGPTGYSAIGTFSVMGVTYCASSGINATSEWIDLVYVGTFLNSTPDSDGGYSDFTYLVAELVQGATYSFTLSAEILGGHFEYWKVWIDFNGDGDLLDAGENIVSYASDQLGWESHSFTVPITAMLGNTLMRVSMKRGSYPTSCENFAKGEVEDYTVNVLPGRTGSIEIADKPTLTIYPNPASEVIHLQSNGLGENKQIQIIDISGKELLNENINSNSTELNIGHLPSGMYFIIATDENANRSTIKFIKN